jgi:hypothetical protein
MKLEEGEDMRIFSFFALAHSCYAKWQEREWCVYSLKTGITNFQSSTDIGLALFFSAINLNCLAPRFSQSNFARNTRP